MVVLRTMSPVSLQLPRLDRCGRNRDRIESDPTPTVGGSLRQTHNPATKRRVGISNNRGVMRTRMGWGFYATNCSARECTYQFGCPIIVGPSLTIGTKIVAGVNFFPSCNRSRRTDFDCLSIPDRIVIGVQIMSIAMTHHIKDWRGHDGAQGTNVRWCEARNATKRTR